MNAGVKLANGPTELAAKGPPFGFGKQLYDNLNLYVRIIDTRVGIQVGMAGGLLAYLVNSTPSASEGIAVYLTRMLFAPSGLLLLVSSIGLALYALRPGAGNRNPGGNLEPVTYYEDISKHDSYEQYLIVLISADEQSIEREYAIGNFILSVILTRKFKILRWSYLLLVMGAICAAAVFLCNFFLDLP